MTTPSAVPTARRRPARSTVADVMSVGLIGCAASTPIDAVARLMADDRIHCVLVEHSGPTGDDWRILSDLDLVAALAVGLTTAEAGAAAASEFVAVGPGETLERAAQMMTEHEATHLVVVAPGVPRPIGVVSTLDLAAAFAAPGARRP